jgi:hypothetical protein
VPGSRGSRKKVSVDQTLTAQTLNEAPSRDMAAILASLGANMNDGLTIAEAHARLLRDGPNEVPEKKTHKLLGFARKFWGLSAWMIELSSLFAGDFARVRAPFCSEDRGTSSTRLRHWITNY